MSRSNTAAVKKLPNSSLDKGTFKTFYRKYGILIIFIIMFIISAIISPTFLKPVNLVNILRQNSVVILIACGETLLIISGMIDLSAGMVATLAGCLAAGMMSSTQSLPIALLCGIGVGAAVGWINGFLITHFKLPPFIATLAMMNVAEGVTQVYTNGSPISGIGSMAQLGQGSIFGVRLIPIPVVIMIAIVLLSWFILKKLSIGTYTYAIGSNERAAIASGINTRKIKRILFVISGAMVGLAGVVLMARLNSGQPGVGAGYEFDAITGVIVGGTSFSGGSGSIFGTLVGALIVGMMNNILNLLNVPTQYQMIVKGLIIAIAVIIDIRTKSAKE